MSACLLLILETARIRVDPVYAALRYGTSLAQMSRSSFGSLSESPTRSVVWCHHAPITRGWRTAGSLNICRGFRCLSRRDHKTYPVRFCKKVQKPVCQLKINCQPKGFQRLSSKISSCLLFNLSCHTRLWRSPLVKPHLAVKSYMSAGAYGACDGWCWSLRPPRFLKRYIGHVCKSSRNAGNYWATHCTVWFRV